MPDHNIAGLPPQYTTDIAVDARGFVRVGGYNGVCVGRVIDEGDTRFLEVKDRNAARSLGRGAQLLRIDAATLLAALLDNRG
jgi:hypothetical protein